MARRARRARSAALAALAVALASAPSARAEGPAKPREAPRDGSRVAQAEGAAPRPAEGEASAATRREAQRHFRRAQELYQQGSYRETIAELEAAVALDPNARELHFNLGVVSERLGRIDAALAHFRRYAEFDLDAQERGRAEKYIRRLEGAKAELGPEVAPAPPPAPVPVADAGGPTEPRGPRPLGRVDAATIAAASVAAAALGTGTVFAVLAVGEKPSGGYVTGRDGSYADLSARADAAHAKAIVADVSFAVAAVATGAAAFLFFGRPAAAPPPATPVVSAAFVPSGGGVTLGGRF